VTVAGLDAGYSSTEAFSRAFTRAFGTAPSLFQGDFRLPAPNGVHFHPPGGLLVPAGNERSDTMDLTDRMLEHDLWLTRELFDPATSIPEERLDETFEVVPGIPHDFPQGTPSVRDMLARLVLSKEIWTAAIAAREAPAHAERSLAGLRVRFEDAGEEFSDAIPSSGSAVRRSLRAWRPRPSSR
jgi:AraC family transcriptional regulator